MAGTTFCSRHPRLIGRLVGATLILSLFAYEQVNLLRQPLPCHADTSRPASYYYPEFDDDETKTPLHADLLDPNHPNQVAHFAEFGLGHRFSKISSAWHLTKSLNLTRMRLFWGDCKGTLEISSYLFGTDIIDVPGSEHVSSNSAIGNVGKTIKVKNDVDGYYKGHNYKRHRIALSKKFVSDESPFMQKYKSDIELYKILRKRFVGKYDAMQFMEANKFRDHFVIGIHLRLGNGEQSHFKQAGREVDNQLEFVYKLIDLLKLFVEDLRKSHPDRFVFGGCLQGEGNKAPLFFLATDTPNIIPIISNYTQKEFGIDTIVIPQFRIEKGVTFTIKEGQECSRGWYDMLLDNTVLSFSDVLIAARYSTFTQSMPMPLIFDRAGGRPGPHFCEVGDSGSIMTCLEDMRTWLFRDDPKKIFTYSIEDSVNEQEVVHLMTYHLPDPDPIPSSSFLEASWFLNPPPPRGNDRGELPGNTTGVQGWYGRARVMPNTARNTVIFGTQFNSKYRTGFVCEKCSHFKMLDH